MQLSQAEKSCVRTSALKLVKKSSAPSFRANSGMARLLTVPTSRNSCFRLWNLSHDPAVFTLSLLQLLFDYYASANIIQFLWHLGTSKRTLVIDVCNYSYVVMRLIFDVLSFNKITKWTFNSKMRPHIDVQADWRRSWTYIWSGHNAISKSSLTCSS